MKLDLLCVLILSVSCFTSAPRTPENQCVPDGLTHNGSYFVKPNAVTPGGIPVDTSGVSVDLADIDRRVAAVASCLHVTPLRGCPVIKIAPDSVKSCVGPYRLLPIPAPGYGCTEKGQSPSYTWRAVIQTNGAVVVPPDLYNLGDPLTRIFGAINDPWRDSIHSTCALAGDGIHG